MAGWLLISSYHCTMYSYWKELKPMQKPFLWRKIEYIKKKANCSNRRRKIYSANFLYVNDFFNKVLTWLIGRPILPIEWLQFKAQILIRQVAQVLPFQKQIIPKFLKHPPKCCCLQYVCCRVKPWNPLYWKKVVWMLRGCFVSGYFSPKPGG